MSKTLWQHYIDVSKRFLDNSLTGLERLEDWQAKRAEVRRHFMRSVGLDVLPSKTDLQVVNHGTLKGPGFRTEKLSFQIMPDCHGTCMVYYPDPLPAGKLPGVLYLCGHNPIGVHGYSKHGVLWSRRGYVCLVLDTIQQHDNPGMHSGLGLKRRYDWISMGYPGSCGEVWNSIRALDLLAGLPEVDPERIGATGTSGGGSLSFLTGLADERIAAVASNCGVTTPYYTLANRHILSHCDCMYVQNVFQHDTSEFAALLAPKPLLFCYGDEDGLFSHAEYRGMVEKIKTVYRLYGCEGKCELFEYHGPHGYIPESIDRCSRWFDEHLLGDPQRPLQQPEEIFNEPDITIFNGKPPAPNRTALLPELISPVGTVELPRRPEDWPALRSATVERLRREVFPCIDSDPTVMQIESLGDWGGKEPDAVRSFSYRPSFDGMHLWMQERRVYASREVLIGVADPRQNYRTLSHNMADFGKDRHLFIIEPRGSSVTSTREGSQGCDRDNFFLQASTLVGMTPLMLMIQDLHHLLAYITGLPETAGKRFYLYGRGEAAAACLYHAAMNENIAGVVTEQLPPSHRNDAYITGILRVLDIEQACGLLAPRPLALVDHYAYKHIWLNRLYTRLGCPERLINKCQSVAVAMEDVIRLTAPAG
ncbi:MAG: alpha/beta hydrolase family protein [Kiritimatiellia bacterium]|nr:acetylxylan esterase [Lentisphaerota bacterium]